MVSPKKIWNGLRCYRISVPSWFVLNLDVTMLHHCSNNCIGCQSTRELLLEHWLMCTGPSWVSLLSALVIALFRGILVVPWGQGPLAPLVLSCPWQGGVLGMGPSRLLLRGCGAACLCVLGMPPVWVLLGVCLGLICLIGCFPLCFAVFLFCCCYVFLLRFVTFGKGAV